MYSKSGFIKIYSGINISIDSLVRETFKNITGHDRLAEILQGIKNLQDLGFNNIKLMLFY